ncbi:MAG: LytTR family DNA-binding domain-containing protein [Emticicia sp.]|nr:LytTR family DNA-binding domain-containing protein [Emticicia sp.]
MQKIALPMSDSLLFVNLEDILFFEADGSYTYVITKDAKTLVSKKIKEFDELLANDTRFYRIHRSFLINVQQVLKYNKKDGAAVSFAGGYSATIAREKVKEFDEFIAGGEGVENIKLLSKSCLIRIKVSNYFIWF